MRRIAVIAILLLLSLAASELVAPRGHANINGLSASATTIDQGSTTMITIDADEGDGDVQVLVLAGSITAASCPSAPCMASGLPGVSVTISDAGSNVDTVIVTYQAPSPGPASEVVTVIQDNSLKTQSVTVRGPVSEVTVKALIAPGTGSQCGGTLATEVSTNPAQGGLAAAHLCTQVRDSAGNPLPNVTVLYTTNVGRVSPLTDLTSAVGAPANASQLTAGTTGQDGDVATVTANAAGKSGESNSVTFGDPAPPPPLPMLFSSATANVTSTQCSVRVQVTWSAQAPSGATAQLFRRASGGLAQAVGSATTQQTREDLFTPTGATSLSYEVALVLQGAEIARSAPLSTNLSCTGG